jgi:hypothetical protein
MCPLSLGQHPDVGVGSFDEGEALRVLGGGGVLHVPSADAEGLQS